MGYKDSIRTNNASRVTAYHKLHLLEFDSKHSRYFISGIEELALRGGNCDGNVKFDILHNSTVNLTGIFHECFSRIRYQHLSIFVN